MELFETVSRLESINRIYRPRTVSYWTFAFALFSIGGLGFLAIWQLGLSFDFLNPETTGEPKIAMAAPFVFALVAAFSVETFSRTRRCCPWRVKEQLKMALFTAGLLPMDATTWRDYLRIRKPRRRKYDLLEVRFDVLSAKANQDKMREIAVSSAFRHCQNCEIKPYVNRRGRTDGWVMYLWFVPMPSFYDRAIRKNRP